MKNLIGFAASVGVLSLVSYGALSQVQSPAPEIVLKVTQDDLEIISQGLQTQPFGKVAPLFNKLREQITAQQKPVVPPISPNVGEKPKE